METTAALVGALAQDWAPQTARDLVALAGSPDPPSVKNCAGSAAQRRTATLRSWLVLVVALCLALVCGPCC